MNGTESAEERRQARAARIRYYLELALWDAEMRASHDPDTNGYAGYYVPKMLRDEISRPEFKLNPEYEQTHSDDFRDRMRHCFHAAGHALELRELLSATA